MALDVSNLNTPKIGKPELPQTDLAKDVVGWDGQDDPAMPLNFPQRRKWFLLGQIAMMNFLSPLTSSLPAPGVSLMDVDFHNTNSLSSSFVISVFVLGMAILDVDVTSYVLTTFRLCHRTLLPSSFK